MLDGERLQMHTPCRKILGDERYNWLFREIMPDYLQSQPAQIRSYLPSASLTIPAPSPQRKDRYSTQMAAHG